MITATPAPKVVHPHQLWVPYAYAGVIASILVLQLVTFQHFVPALAGFLGANGAPWVACMLALLEVATLPFLLRLSLSPLARICSVLASLSVPVVWAILSLLALLSPHAASLDASRLYNLAPSYVFLLLNLMLLVAAYFSLIILLNPLAFKNRLSKTRK